MKSAALSIAVLALIGKVSSTQLNQLTTNSVSNQEFLSAQMKMDDEDDDAELAQTVASIAESEAQHNSKLNISNDNFMYNSLHSQIKIDQEEVFEKVFKLDGKQNLS
jgi:hypothetical protein